MMGGSRKGEPAIELRACSYVYPSGRRVLDRVDWCVYPGAFVLLSGPTGSGKSTLIRLLLRLVRPTEGVVSVLGCDLASLPASRRPRLRRRIGVVAQDLSLLNDRTVEQNLSLALAVRGKRGRPARRRVAQLLLDSGLLQRRFDRPGELSGGERQRLAVARAAADFPDLVLADEPTAHLDREHATLVLQALERLRTAGSTVVIVTHLVEHFDGMDGERFRLEAGRLLEG